MSPHQCISDPDEDEIDPRYPAGASPERLAARAAHVAERLQIIWSAQAKRLWDIGVERELDFGSFQAYHKSLPAIPEGLLKDDAEFPLLVLVEPRLGLKRLCDLGNIEFSGDGEMFVEYDKRHREFAEPTWIRVQDGRKNRNRAVRDCRKSFAKDELGLTALQGVCAFIHHPGVVTDTDREDGNVMDLSGSVRRDGRDGAACLWVWRGRARLYWDFVDCASPKCGSASRRECKAL